MTTIIAIKSDGVYQRAALLFAPHWNDVSGNGMV